MSETETTETETTETATEFGPPDAGMEVADEPDPAFDEVDEDEDIETPDTGEPEG